MMMVSKDSTALRILVFVGVCGEMPIAALNYMHRKSPYCRKVVTKLINAGYLREWIIKDYKHHVIRSLSLTVQGLEVVDSLLPKIGRAIRENVFSPGPAHGHLDRALRLHRGAYCFATAALMWAYWLPVEKKTEHLGDCPVYFSSYELNKRMGWDSKGARVSGLYIDAEGNGTLFYYLGRSNLHWNPEKEEYSRMRMLRSIQGPSGVYYPTTLGRSLLIGRDWSVAESLVQSNNRRYTHLFKGKSLYDYYYTKTDEDGIRLARMLADYGIQLEVTRELEKRGLVRDKADNDYLFPILKLAAFQPRNDKESFFAPTSGVFLESQRETAELINQVNAEIRTIPKDVWDEIWDDLQRRYQMD